jgi:hypothetical protein
MGLHPGTQTSGPASTALSFGVLAHNCAPYIEKLLLTARAFADEIVVGVDASSSDATEEICKRHADKIFRLEPIGTSENALAWLNEQCSGDWVFRLDHDERPSEELVASLPQLIANNEVTHYHFPRRWLVGESASRWIAQPPWWPDWQTRLFRNIRSIVHIPGVIHSDYVVAGGGARVSEAVIYHYDLVYHSEARRRRKIEQYERIAPAASLSHYYFPEFSAVLTKPITDNPPASPLRPGMSFARKLTEVPFVSLADMRKQARQECEYSPSLFRGRITLSEPVLELQARGSTVVEVQVHNDSDVTWPGEGLGLPEVRISYHWFKPDGEIHDWDGPRTTLPRTVGPSESIRLLADLRSPLDVGTYFLQWDLVIDGVAWFSNFNAVAPKVRVSVNEPVETNVGVEEFQQAGPMAKYLRASARVSGWLRGEEAIAMAAAISALRDGAVVVEIGSFLGSGSILFAGALKLKGAGKLHCIDPFDGSGDAFSVPVYHDLLEQSGAGKSLRQCFDAHIRDAGLSEWVEVHPFRGEDIAPEWDIPVDLLFLDGDQSPEGARLAYDSWFPKVKIRGMIAIHNSGPREYAEHHDGSRLLALDAISSPDVEYIQLVGSITFLRKLQERG